MANSVVINGKKFYELVAVAIRWHEVERPACVAYKILEYEIDFIDPTDGERFIQEMHVTHSLKNVIADELFYKYVSKSLHEHSRIFVSLHSDGNGSVIQSVLPEIIPISRESDEKRIVEH